MVPLQSSSLSGPTVSFWHTSPDWLVSIGLLFSRPSSSLYHSTAFLCIVLKYPYPTGHNQCQSKVASYRGDDGCCHSLSLSVESIVMGVCIVLTHHYCYDNTREWVVIMMLRDMCLVVIGVVIVHACNWWTVFHRHLTSSSSDIAWPRNRDNSKGVTAGSKLLAVDVASLVGMKEASLEAVDLALLGASW